MASRPPSYHQDHRRSTSNPSIHHQNQQDSDLEEEDADSQKPTLPIRPQQKPKTLPGSPAYVSPIPKIGPIPSISTPKEQEKPIPISPNMPTRPKLPPFVGSFLRGKTVDESGDIRDDKTGQLLARAGGDLPSIVGRQVSNSQGDILGDDGELLGYVADVEIEKKSPAQSPRGKGMPRSLFEVVGGSKAALMVDGEGNILDGEGNVVGRFHDNNNPVMRRRREEEEERERAKGETSRGEERREERPVPPQQPVPEQREERQERPPRRTEEERRENAQAWRKENPGESPSDIFLDVKSTTEGIQLTIRIPTVFGGQQVRPNISFS
ncbi:hypothetical protein QBC34DRAFT_159302 [Podospora aff. communis PSN243]|uniref:Uncharacterized protein n=1 Tax=Podospora aff. communis PSN243 TaxID=3040156 RepID=A0AAV9H371_9PEZI|nr:hypothetical protein QBC34DRAFT_159302 [Podospora aff. communis PSN243]